MKIINCEEFDGQIKIELKGDDLTKTTLYLCTTEKKIKGLTKGVTDNQFQDIPEQNIKESEEEWRY